MIENKPEGRVDTGAAVRQLQTDANPSKAIREPSFSFMPMICSGRLTKLIFAALLMGASNFVVEDARADFRLCNNTESLVGVSIGYRTKEGWLTEGWWRVPANSCASLVEGQLTSRYFYVYAEDADQGGQWRGPVFMCTSDKEFKIKGVEDCFARGYERTGFFEVDTGEQANWMVRLTESGQSGATE